MPKIRDLGISFIPVTMRPPEIGGGGADVAQYGQPNKLRYYAGERPQCNLTVKDPCQHTIKPCALTTKDPCENTKPPCENTKWPQDHCTPTNVCKYTQCGDSRQCDASAQDASAVTLPDDAIVQLRQQLRQHVGAELVN